MNNIYIALSTHHVTYCEVIAEKRTSEKNILITIEGLKVNQELFDNLVFIKNSIYNQSESKIEKIKNIVNKIKSYREVVKKLEHFRDEKKITVYFSSLEDVLSNYLLLNFSKQVRGIIFEDGMLNYYEHTIQDVSKLNFTLKKIISLFYGLNFEKYHGHTSGIDYKNVDYQMVRVPEFSVRPNKSKVLSINNYESCELNDNILIVGQEPYGNLFSKTFYLEKIDKLIKAIKADSEFNENKIIFYKTHRHGPRIDTNFFKNKFNNPVKYIEDDISIDYLFFNKIKCKYIYTIDSSAVFSIFQDAPKDVRRNLKISVMPFRESRLTLLFSKLNFIILENDI